MEKEAGKSEIRAQPAIDPPLAVSGVADHLVAQMVQMPADLVAPTCLDGDCEKREPTDDLEPVKVARRLLFLAAPTIGERASGGELREGPAPHQGGVSLDCFIEGKIRLDPGRHLAAESEDHESGGVAVEPVDWINEMADLIPNPLEQEATSIWSLTAAMNEHSWRLVDDDETIVPKEDPGR